MMSKGPIVSTSLGVVGKKGSWDAANSWLSFIPMIGISVLLTKAVITIQHCFIPANVFLWGWRSMGILIPCSALLLALPLGRIVLTSILFSFPSVARAMVEETGESYKSRINSNILFTKFIAPVCVLLLIFGGYNYYYLACDGVTISMSPWSKARHYEWSDIAKIYTQCVHSGRSGTILTYELRMKDGKSVDILESHGREFADAYVKIRPFLKAQSNIVYEMGPMDLPALRAKCGNNADRFIRILENKE